MTSNINENFLHKKHKVVLIGLGNVGFGRYLSKKENQILDHYSAIKNQQSLKLVVCSDKTNPGRIQEKFVKDANELSSLKVDLLVISTPMETHLKVIDKFLERNSAKIILVEKPCTNSMHEMDQLTRLLLGHAETEVVVNYHRNYNHVFIDTFGDSI